MGGTIVVEKNAGSRRRAGRRHSRQALAVEGQRLPPERAPRDRLNIRCLPRSPLRGRRGRWFDEGAEVRVKGKAPLAATRDGDQACGVMPWPGKDSLPSSTGSVEGRAIVSTIMDHRIAMAFLTWA